MPIFEIKSNVLAPVSQLNFDSEKRLQNLVEANLVVTFNSRLVATEFSTGTVHAGRIDTLALSEDKNPVIIEYKRVESSELINQSLFYLHWLDDHHGDFELAARKALGSSVEVDWSDIRVICLAPNYKKYDLHAVQVMGSKGANIELWKYRLFANSSLYLEEVYGKTLANSPDVSGAAKDPLMVAAGKKAAITRATGVYSFDEHLEGKMDKIRELALSVREFMGSIDSAIEEAPKKLYIAYKVTQNIACMEVHKQKITLFLKLDPKAIPHIPAIARDVSNIGHYGTGDLEFNIQSEQDLEIAKPFIQQAYQNIGG